MDVTSERLRQWSDRLDQLAAELPFSPPRNPMLFRAVAAYLRANIPVPVSERLPEEADEVIAAIRYDNDDYPDWALASVDGKGEWNIWGRFCADSEDDSDSECTVTHWLPLPTYPEPSSTT